MLAACWAFTRSEAFWKLVFCVFAYVVAIALALVAGLAEMGVSPAEPLGNAAAELALEFDEIFAMLRAVIYRDFTAIWAD